MKKIMMLALLAGSLTLGACVKNNESPSVEAVRNAKAEQLKGLAALANAQAVAEKITAEANAALTLAQAKFQENETEEAKQKFAHTIKQIQADVEKAIAQAKAATLLAESEFLKNADAKIKELYTEFAYYSDALATVNDEILRKTVALAGLEAGVVSAEAVAKVINVQNNRFIKNELAKLEVLKDPAYESIDKDKLMAELASTKQQLDLEASRLRNNEGEELLASKTSLEDAIDNAGMVAEVFEGLINTAILFKRTKVVEINRLDGQLETVEMPTDPYVYENGLLQRRRSLKANIEGSAEILGTPSDLKDKDSAYGKLAKANFAMTEATNMPENNDAEKLAKKQAIESAEVEVAVAKDNLVNAQRMHDVAKEASEDFESEYELAVASFDKYNEAILDVLEAEIFNLVAYEAYEEASALSVNLGAKVAVLNDLLVVSQSIPELVASCESKIAGYEEMIIGNEASIGNAEAMLENNKELISNLKIEAAALKVSVEKAKAALDAGVAKQ